MMLLSSCISMRRTGLILGIHPITVARKLEYMAVQSCLKWVEKLQDLDGISSIQVDEFQTIEHTKCKPLSFEMAVSEDGIKIIGFHVSTMSETGYLAQIYRKKYGYRPDCRIEGMSALFEELKKNLSPYIVIKSDKCPFYNQVI